MIPCRECIYSNPAIYSGHHLECLFKWDEYFLEQLKKSELASMPQNIGSERTKQWFMFPFNYDPVWGDKCDCFAAAKTENTREKAASSMITIAGLLTIKEELNKLAALNAN